ncbi:MarP family serine protease [Rubrobacter calidifluminis]|uniref:MarP family serine protease n=1 Tax=Rubrobacter calidifluminis TaxID=1392640 RepID=UPI00235F1331|nr:MarP family serine protease [Rubrobacter calidifluminis]
MGILDFFIVFFALLVALRGARTGFLAGALSLAGMVLGASVGSRIAPLLLPQGENPISGVAITLVGIVAFAILGDVVARAFGNALRSRLRGPIPGILDWFGGAALGLALALVLIWVVGSFALKAPSFTGLGSLARDSRILQALDHRMPAGFITRAVARLDPLPQIQGPSADVPTPTRRILEDPDVLDARSSVVRVTGVACGYGVEGTGWVAAPNTVVTNAHVVAGESFTRVQPGGVGPMRAARVVFFNPKNDIAILKVHHLGMRPLSLGVPEPGEPVAVIGFPDNGPLDVQPGRTGETQQVISTNAYNRGPVERTVTSFRVFVRPGNSGGPAVDGGGRVVATIFASRADSNRAGYGIPTQVVERYLSLAAGRTKPVSTGSCTR